MPLPPCRIYLKPFSCDFLGDGASPGLNGTSEVPTKGPPSLHSGLFLSPCMANGCRVRQEVLPGMLLHAMHPSRLSVPPPSHAEDGHRGSKEILTFSHLTIPFRGESSQGGTQPVLPILRTPQAGTLQLFLPRDCIPEVLPSAKVLAGRLPGP